MTFTEGQRKKRLHLFKMKFLHGFLLNETQRSAQCLTWSRTKTYTSAVCEPILRWPCSIAGLAVAVFIALPCVYSPVFYFNVVPATECSNNDGWWRLKHAERRVKSRNTLLLSVSMKNQWNKVFLTVSGEFMSWMRFFLYNSPSFSDQPVELLCL